MGRTAVAILSVTLMVSAVLGTGSAVAGAAESGSGAVDRARSEEPTAPRADEELRGLTPLVGITYRDVGPGDHGFDVRWIQNRLIELRFDPGTPDGKMGQATLSALWALEKISGLEPVDNVTPEVWDVLLNGVDIQPLVADGEPTRAEIDLDLQVMEVWRDGELVLVTHISSGSGKGYCNGGRCRRAVTPTGDYTINRTISGWRHAPLGNLYNPLYFNGGIAIHGSGFVPTWPDSHGCVRVPMHVAEELPSIINRGVPVHVISRPDA